MATIKSFRDLKAVGGIVSKKPILRTISWQSNNVDGEPVDYEAEVLILKPPAGLILDVYGDDSHETIASLLSKCLMLQNEKGSPELISYEDAYQLDTPLRSALWNEVQKVGGMVRKNSPEATSSSVSLSPTGSAGEQSPKPESA